MSLKLQARMLSYNNPHFLKHMLPFSQPLYDVKSSVRRPSLDRETNGAIALLDPELSTRWPHLQSSI